VDAGRGRPSDRTPAQWLEVGGNLETVTRTECNQLSPAVPELQREASRLGRREEEQACAAIYAVSILPRRAIALAASAECLRVLVGSIPFNIHLLIEFTTRFHKECFDPISREMGLPWRAVETMIWRMGHEEIATRANVAPFLMNMDATRSPPDTSMTASYSQYQSPAGPEHRNRRSSSSSAQASQRRTGSMSKAVQPLNLPPVNEGQSAIKSEGEDWYPSPTHRPPGSRESMIVERRGSRTSRCSADSRGSAGSGEARREQEAR